MVRTGFNMTLAVVVAMWAPGVLAQAGPKEGSHSERKPADPAAVAEVIAPKVPIALFDGETLDGWVFHLKDGQGDPAQTWSVRDGVVSCTGTPAGYMRTEQRYTNYRLTFEWRWPAEPGNGGLLLHIQLPDTVWPKSIEGQLQHEHAADFWVIGGAEFKEHTDPEDRRVPKQHPHNEKPLGEWNLYEAVCDGDTIRLSINGLLQNTATEVTVTDGYIGFQSEGAPIELRNIVVHPLDSE